jgi:hypothetical protein
VLDLRVDQFPEWWPAEATATAFTLVADRADAAIAPLPRPWWTADDFARAADAIADTNLPTAVYLPIDSWDDPSRGWSGPAEWTDLVHEYAALVDIVAGPQLPATGGPPRALPLPYPPMADRVPAPPDLRDARIALTFAGYFTDPGWAAPPIDSRDRRHRGHLVALLEAGLPPDQLHIRRVQFWGDHDDHDELVELATKELDNATIGFAPAGYGHLTFRHADVWARGRVLLTEPLHRDVLVPEPERWESGDIGLLYDPDGHNLVEVVEAALRHPERLATIARAGWDYGRRWTNPANQAAQLAAALKA